MAGKRKRVAASKKSAEKNAKPTVTATANEYNDTKTAAGSGKIKLKLGKASMESRAREAVHGDGEEQEAVDENEEEPNVPPRKVAKLKLNMPLKTKEAQGKQVNASRTSAEDSRKGRGKRTIKLSMALRESIRDGQPGAVPIVPRNGNVHPSEAAVGPIKNEASTTASKGRKRPITKSNEEYGANDQPVAKVLKVEPNTITTKESNSHDAPNNQSVKKVPKIRLTMSQNLRRSERGKSSRLETVQDQKKIQTPVSDIKVKHEPGMDIHNDSEADADYEGQDSGASTNSTEEETVEMPQHIKTKFRVKAGSADDVRHPSFPNEDRTKFPLLDEMLTRWEDATTSMDAAEKLAVSNATQNLAKPPTSLEPDEVESCLEQLERYHEQVRAEHAKRRRAELRRLLQYYKKKSKEQPLGFARGPFGKGQDTARWYYWDKDARDAIWKKVTTATKKKKTKSPRIEPRNVMPPGNIPESPQDFAERMAAADALLQLRQGISGNQPPNSERTRLLAQQSGGITASTKSFYRQDYSSNALESETPDTVDESGIEWLLEDSAEEKEMD